MFKKFIAGIATICILTLFTTGVFAALPSNLYEKVASSNTDTVLINIAKPSLASDTVFRENYFISGSGVSDVRVYLLKYNAELDKYVDYPSVYTEKAFTWDIDDSGIFYQEFSLSMGDNKIRVVAIHKDGNYQIVNKTVTRLDKSLKDIIKGTLLNIENIFSIFKPNN